MEGESWDSERTHRDDGLEHSQCFLIMLKFTSDFVSWPWYPTYLKKKKKKNSLEGLSNERAHLKHTLVVPAARPASTSAGWPQGSSQTLRLIRGFTEYYFCLLKIGILGNTQSRCLISHTWEYTVEVSYFFQICQHCSFFFLIPSSMKLQQHHSIEGFPDSSVGKEAACNAGDPSLIPGLGRPAGEGIGYPLTVFLGFPCGSTGKESACNVGRPGFSP